LPLAWELFARSGAVTPFMLPDAQCRHRADLE
jgi:hypothetical protein